MVPIYRRLEQVDNSESEDDIVRRRKAGKEEERGGERPETAKVGRRRRQNKFNKYSQSLAGILREVIQKKSCFLSDIFQKWPLPPPTPSFWTPLG